jgi:hypothetical protein
MKNPDDLAKTQFLTKNTDIIFTHEICGLGQLAELIDARGLKSLERNLGLDKFSISKEIVFNLYSLAY